MKSRLWFKFPTPYGGGRKGGTNTAIPHMVAREYRNTASQFTQIPKPQLPMGKSWRCQSYKSSFHIEIILLCQCFEVKRAINIRSSHSFSFVYYMYTFTKWYNRSFLVSLYILLTWIINGWKTVDSYKVVSDSQLTRFCVEGFKTTTRAAFWIRRAHSTH